LLKLTCAPGHPPAPQRRFIEELEKRHRNDAGDPEPGRGEARNKRNSTRTGRKNPDQDPVRHLSARQLDRAIHAAADEAGRRAPTTHPP